jgi:hypothetical protein
MVGKKPVMTSSAGAGSAAELMKKATVITPTKNTNNAYDEKTKSSRDMSKGETS